MDMPAEHRTEPSSGQSSPGPQLLHRSAASGNSSVPDKGEKSQTVALIDPDASGQAGKNGSSDGKQALQQTATAVAGMYKRLSALDRH
jgi:hypothetical protein